MYNNRSISGDIYGRAISGERYGGHLQLSAQAKAWAAGFDGEDSEDDKMRSISNLSMVSLLDDDIDLTAERNQAYQHTQYQHMVIRCIAFPSYLPPSHHHHTPAPSAYIYAESNQSTNRILTRFPSFVQLRRDMNMSGNSDYWNNGRREMNMSGNSDMGLRRDLNFSGNMSMGGTLDTNVNMDDL